MGLVDVVVCVIVHRVCLDIPVWFQLIFILLFVYLFIYLFLFCVSTLGVS